RAHGPARGDRAGGRRGGDRRGGQPEVAERGDGDGQLHPDGRGVALQPQPVRRPAGRQFAFTRPANSQTLKLPAGKTRVTIPVPDELVEVSTAGKTRVAPYFAGETDVK